MKIYLNVVIWSMCAFVLAACQTTSGEHAPTSYTVKFDSTSPSFPGDIELTALPNWMRVKNIKGKIRNDARGLYLCPAKKCKEKHGLAAYYTQAREIKGKLQSIKDAEPRRFNAYFKKIFSKWSLRSNGGSKSTSISFRRTGKIETSSLHGFPAIGATAYARGTRERSRFYVHYLVIFDENTEHIFRGLATNAKTAKQSSQTLASAWRPPAGS